MSAATPWLVGAAVGLLLLWLVLLIREKKLLAKELRWFHGLAPMHKFVVAFGFCLLAFWGGSKERGLPSQGSADGTPSTLPNGSDVIQPRTAPDGTFSNALMVTCFEFDQTNRIAFFEVRWDPDLLDSADSRLLHLFSATNLQERQWMQIGSFLMPQGTNSHAFAVASNTVDAAMRQFFFDTFNGVGFYRFGIDLDSDGDGLIDAFETLCSHTDPAEADTDGDGLPDGWEHDNGLDPNSWSDAYADPDGDGLPNLYEYHHGSQPLLADAGSVERIVAGGTGSNAVATLSAALAASGPYSVIEVADGVHEGSGWSGFDITLPEHPVLITSSDGGRSRRAIIRHTEQLAAMYLNATQTTHTVVQGLCYELAATNGMQMAFWCGGNTPWSGPPAGGMFRDIYVRMPNPGVEYEGWFFRHYESNEVVVASCTVNAFGATNARGIYAVDSPPMSVENCTFANFPSNHGGLGYGIQYESTLQNWGGAPDPIPLEIVNCLFDVSFTNAYALAPLENGVSYDVTMLNCIVPSLLEYEADHTEGLIVTNAGVSFAGHIPWDSPARGAGVASLYAPLDIDGQERGESVDVGADQFVSVAGTVDTDGDGLSDADEDWLYGTDPFFADSDCDGSPDADEIANGTDPLNRLSHLATITLFVTNTHASASLTNYFGFSTSPSGWDVADAFATTGGGIATNATYNTTNLYGKAFADLNRNGVFDEDADVIVAVCLESEYALVNATIVLGDIDGDGIPDSVEMSDGTSPVDRLNYCFNCKVAIDDIFSTTNELLAQATLGDACLYGPEAQTNSTLALDLGHLVVTNGERVVIYFWDDHDGDMLRDDGEPYSSVTVYVQSHDAQYRYSLPRGGFDANGDGLFDWWQAVYGLDDGQYVDTDGDGLINLHEFWAGTNPTVPDGSNTVLSVASRSVDDLLAAASPSNSLERFENYQTNGMSLAFVPNTNFWARSIDLSCASMWNQIYLNMRAGTAISRRHLLFAKHFDFGSGLIYFSMDDGSVHTNAVIAKMRHPTPNVDISVGLLAYDLPLGIKPAKVLPRNYYTYIKNGHRLPTISLDQEEHALVHDVSNFATGVYRMYPQGLRNEFCEPIIGGDSGNPVFMVMGNEVVLLCTFLGGGAGSGPAVRYYCEDIQSLMDTLSLTAGLEVTNYQLEEYNFGGFDQCEN